MSELTKTKLMHLNKQTVNILNSLFSSIQFYLYGALCRSPANHGGGVCISLGFLGALLTRGFCPLVRSSKANWSWT